MEAPRVVFQPKMLKRAQTARRHLLILDPVTGAYGQQRSIHCLLPTEGKNVNQQRLSFTDVEIVKLPRRISVYVMEANERRFTTLVLNRMAAHVVWSLRLSKTAMTAKLLVLVLAAALMDPDQPAI
jgi:hypothetical protein